VCTGDCDASGSKQFVTKLVWDSLSADACPIEMVSTNNGKLPGYHNLDYETIRLTVEASYEGDDEIRAVQLNDGIPAVAFTYDDILCPDFVYFLNVGSTVSANSRAGSRVSRPKNSMTNMVQPAAMCS
jgi:hypothetical protein